MKIISQNANNRTGFGARRGTTLNTQNQNYQAFDNYTDKNLIEMGGPKMPNTSTHAQQ